MVQGNGNLRPSVPCSSQTDPPGNVFPQYASVLRFIVEPFAGSGSDATRPHARPELSEGAVSSGWSAEFEHGLVY